MTTRRGGGTQDACGNGGPVAGLAVLISYPARGVRYFVEALAQLMQRHGEGTRDSPCAPLLVPSHVEHDDVLLPPGCGERGEVGGGKRRKPVPSPRDGTRVIEEALVSSLPAGQAGRVWWGRRQIE